jgi:hypothetical protein
VVICETVAVGVTFGYVGLVGAVYRFGAVGNIRVIAVIGLCSKN